MRSIIIVNMANESMSKKELKELRRLQELQNKNLESRQNLVKWVTISVVSVVFLAFLSVAIFIGKNQDNNPTAQEMNANFANDGHTRMVSVAGDAASNSAEQDSAAVTIIEYADIQCPACKAYHPMVKSLLELYPGQVKLIFKHFPIASLHPNATNGAIAAEAAGKQGKFFEMVDMQYEKQEEWAALPDPMNKFAEYAQSLGLDLPQFKRDLADKTLADVVEKHRNEGIKNGVNATPSFFINGKKINNPADINEFQQYINQELEKTQGETSKTQIESPSPTAPLNQLPLQ